MKKTDVCVGISDNTLHVFGTFLAKLNFYIWIHKNGAILVWIAILDIFFGVLNNIKNHGIYQIPDDSVFTIYAVIQFIVISKLVLKIDKTAVIDQADLFKEPWISYNQKNEL